MFQSETIVSNDAAEGAMQRPARRRQSTAVRTKPAQRAASSASVVYRDLREEIVSLRRPPGAPVSEKQIADSYGVSRTPVREAMLRLAGEGLIEIYPQSGTFVSRIPVSGLRESFAIRRVLEETVVRRAAARATCSQLAELDANIERQHGMEAIADQDGFQRCDKAFHALLADIAGHPGFWALIVQSNTQVDRYRRLTLPLAGRMRAVIAEHEAIAAAIADHDPDRAVQALANHLNRVETAIANADRCDP